MATLDLENLAPGPSDEMLASLATADRGDAIVEEEVEQAQDEQKTEAEIEAEALAALAGAKKTSAAATEGDEAPQLDADGKEVPRDEKGRFAIPKERFDEAVGKERVARESAERRAEEAERRLEETAANAVITQNFEQAEAEIVELEKQYTAAMLDGDGDKAALFQGQIRRATQALSEERSQQRATIVAANALESDRVDAVVARLEADNPVLNPKSELYRPKLVRAILNEQRFLISSEGLAPSAALKRAAEEAVAELPAPVAVKEGLAEAQDDKGKGRKPEAVKRNLAAANKQPSNLKEVGMDSDKFGQNAPFPKASDLTREEFDALPESTKAKMRGDFI